MVNARALIEPPVFTPLPFGLLSAAIDRTPEAPAHWEAGVTWQSYCPDSGLTYDPCFIEVRDNVDDELTETDAVSGAIPLESQDANELFLRGATSFSVYAGFQCSPVGIWDRAEQLSADALTRTEAHQVERAVSVGQVTSVGGTIEGIFPHLQENTPLVEGQSGATLQTAAQVVTATPQSLTVGLGLLEAALADCYHGQGVLHVPAVFGTQLSANTIVTQRGNALTTLMNNKVALGSGYPGDAPDAAAAEDVAWIYATGAVFYFRSQPRITQVEEFFDRSVNTVRAIAQRVYVVGWDCCHLAVPIDIGAVTP